MKLDFSWQIMEKYSNIKFHEHPAGGSRVVSCEQTDERTDGQTDRRTDRQTDITNLIVALHNFANAPKKLVDGELSCPFSVALQPKSGLGRLIVEASRSHKTRHTTSGRTSLNEWSARLRGCFLHNTQETQQTNIHALSRSLTRDPSKQAAADVRLRPHGYRNRWFCVQILSH
jgi:hypothetical protein